MKTINEQILEAIDLCRSIVLDSVEMELGDSPSWDSLRSRLLRAFGNKGLTRRLIDILMINEKSSRELK